MKADTQPTKKIYKVTFLSNHYNFDPLRMKRIETCYVESIGFDPVNLVEKAILRREIFIYLQANQSAEQVTKLKRLSSPCESYLKGNSIVFEAEVEVRYHYSSYRIWIEISPYEA